MVPVNGVGHNPFMNGELRGFQNNNNNNKKYEHAIAFSLAFLTLRTTCDVAKTRL